MPKVKYNQTVRAEKGAFAPVAQLDPIFGGSFKQEV